MILYDSKKIILSMLLLIACIGYLKAQPVKKDTIMVGCYFPEMPHFPGGDDSLKSYIKHHLKWPGLHWNEQGTVYVKFKIDCKGNISDAKILKGFDSLAEQEALRLVREMPKWVTELCDKQPESVWWNLPIKFKQE